MNNNISNESFVHLHVHSEYSLLDGACRLTELVKKAAELGQGAVAVTDHGVMYGAVDFYKEAKKAGVKPIIGCEIYIAPRTRFDRDLKLDISPNHLLLLCENNTGYRSLIKLVSRAYTEGYFIKPRADIGLLKEHSEGLICLSSCLAGEIPSMLLNNDYEGAKKKALEYRSIYGENNFFLEIQNHGIKDEKLLIQRICRLSEDTGIPLVATNDVHYVEKTDSEIQNLLMCVQLKKTVFDNNPLKFPNDEFYLKSTEEMCSIFREYPEAVRNTRLIADRCNVEMEFGVVKLPEFKIDGEGDNKAFFIRLCAEGLERRYGKDYPDNVKQRMDYEIDVISRMGYVDYYLIVWDFVKYAKDNGIPVGPGRGSGAGSICAYCIGITDIDPIKYNLLFERFLNPERVSMPDFDIDFCIEGRQKVIEYVVNKYGKERVSQIIAFDTLKARAAVKDTGRALGLPIKFCSEISSMIPKDLNMTLSLALGRNPELRERYNTNPTAKRLIDLSMKIEGMPRNDTVHAAGVVISGVPVTDLVPVKRTGNTIVTQYTMTALESLGLLKMDFLGLRNLTIIRNCTDKIKEKDPSFDINKIPVDDRGTFEMMSRGETTGVFQFESAGMRRVLSQLKPENLEDLIAIISLYRPGPSDSIPKYIRNKHNPDKIKYRHPLLRNILDVTYGCMVYQEQVMEICRRLAGYSYGRADLVRRAMAKKKHDVMEKERRSFVYGDDGSSGSSPCCGAVANGVSEQAANEIFDEMSGFASYAFNKSHAAAYAYLSYQTAYLKCNYTKEYMAALMSSVFDNTEKLAEYANECRLNNIALLRPDINKSDEGFTVEEEGIRYGLLAVKTLGLGIIRDIIAERRRNGDFKSLKSFCERTVSSGIGRTALEYLIKAGAFDGMGANRRQMISKYLQFLGHAAENSRLNVEGQFDLFSGEGGTGISPYEDYKPLDEFRYSDILCFEKFATGMYISGHPVDPYKTVLRLMRVPEVCSLSEGIKEGKLKNGTPFCMCGVVDDISVRYTFAGRKMGFITIQDPTGFAECTVFPDVFIPNEKKLDYGNLLFIRGRVSSRPRYKDTFVAEEICDEKALEEIIAKKKLCVKAESSGNGKISAVSSIVKKYPGKTPFCFYFTDIKKLLRPRGIAGVSISPGLYRELCDAAGEQALGLID